DDEDDDVEFADEEDVDAEQAPLSADAHMAQLQKLAETDPEFYAFLAKNDKHLLEFQDQDDAEAEEAEEAEVLTKETVLQWRKQLEQCYRLPTLSRLVAAFQEAVKATVHKNAPNDGKPARFIIRDPKVANLTIAVARRTVSQVLSHHLKIKMPSTDSVSANKAVTLPAELPTWKRCRGVVRRYISSMTDLIRQSHSTALLTFLLRNPQDLGVYAVCFARLKQTFLEVVAQKWALGETAVRAHAFMALRRIAIMFPHHALGDVYKFMYKQFSLLTKKYDARNALDATFTMNCMVELNGLHPATTYRFGFGQIKKLAMLLRKAMHTQSGKEENKQSLAALYAWSTYQTVALWRHTLVTYIPLEDAADGLMSLLVYPLTQIALGIMKLKCSSRYLPMHANLLRELVALCQGTGVFIPLAPYAIAMINLVLARKNVTKSTLKPVPFHTTTRVANAYVGTVVYRQTVLNEASELLTDICGLQAHHIAFPEFVLPVMVQLRKMMKIDNPQAQIAVTKAVKPLLSKLRENADFINAKRKRVTFHPSDAEAVAAFELQLLEMGTPLGRHVQARQRVLERQREADE
ncbi:Noc2-domain-containing protein, partial [Caulochytrium protostelioides]